MGSPSSFIEMSQQPSSWEDRLRKSHKENRNIKHSTVKRTLGFQAVLSSFRPLFLGPLTAFMLVPNHPHPSFSIFLLSFPIPFFLLFPPYLFFFPFPPLKSKRSDGKEPGRFRQTPSDKRNRDGFEEGTSRGYTFGIHAGIAPMCGRK